MLTPRRFRLVRGTDVSGVSGTGVVAYGVKFGDGKVVTRWVATAELGVAQTCIWDSIAHVDTVHGHGGATWIEWLDSAPDTTPGPDPLTPGSPGSDPTGPAGEAG